MVKVLGILQDCFLLQSFTMRINSIQVRAIRWQCFRFAALWCERYCHYLWQGGCVLPGVCLAVCLSFFLSVCLLATSCENYWSDFRENCTRDVSVDKEKLIKIWKLSAFGFRSRNFWRILQQCEIGHFSTIWLIRGKTDGIFMIGTSFALVEVCVLWVLLFPL